MKFTLLYLEAPAEAARRDGPEAPAYWGAWTAYIGALRDAGIVAGGEGLMPAATAATLRVKDGRRDVQDGPFVDSKEQLGGYMIIDVPDMAAALEWAARAPCAAAGAVEVRPCLPPMPT
jgi:hypothetical protein